MKIFMYVRASTTKQQVTLEVQRERMENWIVGQQMMGQLPDDVELIHVVDSGVSGSTKLFERPEGQKILREAGKGDMIMCYRLDRMFRNTLDCCDSIQRFQDLGISFVSVDQNLDVTTKFGKLIAHIMGALAEFERDMICARQAEARDRMYHDGYVPGVCISKNKTNWAPIGWTRAKQGRGKEKFKSEHVPCIPCQEERDFIEQVLLPRLEGGESVNSVYTWLKLRDINRHVGCGWRQDSLRDLRWYRDKGYPSYLELHKMRQQGIEPGDDDSTFSRAVGRRAAKIKREVEREREQRAAEEERRANSAQST